MDKETQPLNLEQTKILAKACLAKVPQADWDTYFSDRRIDEYGLNPAITAQVVDCLKRTQVVGGGSWRLM